MYRGSDTEATGDDRPLSFQALYAGIGTMGGRPGPPWPGSAGVTPCGWIGGAAALFAPFGPCCVGSSAPGSAGCGGGALLIIWIDGKLLVNASVKSRESSMA